MEIQLKQTSERVYYMILNGAKQIFINSKGRTIAEYYDCSKNSDEKTEEYFYIPVVGYPYRLESEGFRRLYTEYDTKKIAERALNPDRNTPDELREIANKINDTIKQIENDVINTQNFLLHEAYENFLKQ